ncbi:TPA: hypothetical protein EYP44_00095, partial [Candidatus Bathyarchaeota archaeon]|nr:hypothetical protein [Candidatus Bathyarchaeota archaeon]
MRSYASVPCLFSPPWRRGPRHGATAATAIAPPPAAPDYGTHDWIAERAKDWLPAAEREWIDEWLHWFLYGTEYPDNADAAYGATSGYGDTSEHHVYYSDEGSVLDDSAAVRAREEFCKALDALREGKHDVAAIYAGAMTHYIADLAVFAHVMTGEAHHGDYEGYVERHRDEFERYLEFDGELDVISAYDAAIELGWDTYGDDGGPYTALWMDTNYNWSDPAFRDRCGESINLGVNYIADVLHTLAVCAEDGGPAHVVINEVEQDPPGEDAGNEWVELYNPTDGDVDIGGWTVSTTHGRTVTVTIPQGTVIASKGYWVYTHEEQWLDNEGESVVLRDADGAEIDKTRAMDDDEDDERSWQRFPNGVDTDSDEDWQFRLSMKEESNGAPDAMPPVIADVRRSPEVPDD